MDFKEQMQLFLICSSKIIYKYVRQQLAFSYFCVYPSWY